MSDLRVAILGLRQAIDILGLQPNQRTPSQLAKLAGFLRSQDGFFGPLSQADAEVVSKWLVYEYFPPGKTIHQQGQCGDCMYIILGGVCEVLPLSGAVNAKDLLVQGQAFGELSLVAPRKPHSRTVMAGPGGTHLAVLSRSAVGNMRFLGTAQPDAHRALQAVLAACCMGVLRVPPGCRTSEEVETLAEFLSTMEAFKKLPADMLRRLAGDCAHLRLPTARVVFEEDAPGNCMYVVVSGQCQVRARPLARGSRAHRPASLGIGMSMSPRRGPSSRHIADSTPRSLTSFASTVIAAMSERHKEKEREQELERQATKEKEEDAENGESDPASGKKVGKTAAGSSSAADNTAAGAGAGAAASGHGPPGRRRFGHEARGGGRPGGVLRGGAGRTGSPRTALSFKVRSTGTGTGTGAPELSTDDDEEPPPQHRHRDHQPQPNGGGANKDSPFWIARYMDDALKRLHLTDTSAGLGQDMTPLAAVAAARWRQVAAVQPPGAAAAAGDDGEGVGEDGEEVDGDGGAAGGGEEGPQEVMEALLGRAAARVLRQTVMEQRGRGAGGGGGGHHSGMMYGMYEMYDRGHDSDVEGRPGSRPAGTAAAVPDPAAAAMYSYLGLTDSNIAALMGGDLAAGASGIVPDSTASPISGMTPRSGSPEDGGGGGIGVSFVGIGADDGSDASPSRRPHRRVSMSDTASMYGTGAGSVTLSGSNAATTVAMEDPAKRLLAHLGSRDPSNVSRALVAELVQRADVRVVLYEVAKKLVRRGGGPRRINQTTSQKINRALHMQIRAGQDRLPAMLQGHRVLGRHASVSGSKNGGGYGGYGNGNGAMSTGADGSIATSGQTGGGGGGGGRGGSSSWVRQASVAESGHVGESPKAAVSRHAHSFNAGSSSHPRPGGTRPVSALTSGVSAILDNENTEYGEDGDTEYDWNGSDLYSLSSYKPSVVSGVSHAGGLLRRLTSHELEHNNLAAVDLSCLADLDAAYGPVIRTITAGQSFGELALLHRDSRRTATVITVPASSSALHAFLPLPPPVPGSDHSVDLICITRHTYNYTVRATQVSQLQGLLSFLAGLAPFRGLDDQQRASLAVFCRPREVPAGTVLVLQGEPAQMLWMVQEGEVVVLDTAAVPLTDPLLTAPPLQPLERAGLTRSPSRQPKRSSSLTLARTEPGATAATAAGPGGQTSGGSGAGRVVLRQVSAPEAGAASAAVAAEASATAVGSGSVSASGTAAAAAAAAAPAAGTTSTAAVVAAAVGRTKGRTVAVGAGGGRKDTSSRRVGFASGTLNHVGVAPGDADGPQRLVSLGALAGLKGGGVITVMGPGGVFGEGLLQAAPPVSTMPWGVDEDDEPPKDGQKSKRRHNGAPPPPYPFTVIARKPTKLLTITANDLSRFEDFVAGPLAELAAARAEFLAARTASLAAAKKAVLERAKNARRVLRNLRATVDAGIPIAANPALVAELEMEEANHAAAEAAMAAAEAAAVAAATSASTGNTPVSTPFTGQGSMRRRGSSTDSLRGLVAGLTGGAPATVARSAAGKRAMAQLLPGAVLRRLTDVKDGTATIAAVTAAMQQLSSVSATVVLEQAAHPIAGRLTALLSAAAPQLPERSTPDRTPSPSALSSSSSSLLSSAAGAMQPPPVDATAWPFFAFGSGSMRCLSTIAEESSTGMLRTTGSMLETTPLTVPLGVPDSAGSIGLGFGKALSPSDSSSMSSDSRMESSRSSSVQDVAAVAEPPSSSPNAAAATAAAPPSRGVPRRAETIDPRLAMEAFGSGSSSEIDLLAAEALPEEDLDLDLSYRTARKVPGVATEAATEDAVRAAADGASVKAQMEEEGPGRDISVVEMPVAAATATATTTTTTTTDTFSAKQMEQAQVAEAAVAPAVADEMQTGDATRNTVQLPVLRQMSTGALRSESGAAAAAASIAAAPGTAASTAQQLPPLQLPLYHGQGSRSRRFSETGPASSSASRSAIRLSSAVLPQPVHAAAPSAAAEDTAATNTGADLPPLQPRPPRQPSMPIPSPPQTPYAPPSTIETMSQDSFRSYLGISPSPSAGIAGVPTTAGSADGGGGSLPRSPLYTPSDNIFFRQRAASADGSGFASGSRSGSGDGDSIVVYTDDGTASPDLTHVRYEPAAARARASMMLPSLDLLAGRLAAAGAGPVRRSASSSVSDGLVPLSGFTSATFSAATSVTAAVPSMPPLLEAGATGATYDTYDDGSSVVMEARGASLERLVGGRPRPLSRGDSFAGSSGRRSLSGRSSSILTPSSSQRRRSQAGDAFPPPLRPLADMYNEFGGVGSRPDSAIAPAPPPQPRLSSALVPQLRLPSAQPAPPPLAPSSVLLSSAAAPLSFQPPQPPRRRETSGGAPDSVHHAPSDASGGGVAGPILPWSRVDGNTAAPTAVAAEAPEAPEVPEAPPPLPVLPPLAIMAMRRQLATEDGDVLGVGPQSCSPRAARTDSPLRLHAAGHHGFQHGLDSPVHSPKVVSQVY